MSISSFVIRARPERVEALVEELSRLAGCDVHAWNAKGQMVVTLDEPDDGKAAERMGTLNLLDGVLGISLVFSQFDQIPTMEE